MGVERGRENNVTIIPPGAIRRILRVSRQRVRDEKNANSAVRKKFMNMPTMMNIVKRRILKYI
jgi:hypothetical protein